MEIPEGYFEEDFDDTNSTRDLGDTTHLTIHPSFSLCDDDNGSDKDLDGHLSISFHMIPLLLLCSLFFKTKMQDADVDDLGIDVEGIITQVTTGSDAPTQNGTQRPRQSGMLNLGSSTIVGNIVTISFLFHLIFSLSYLI